MLIWRDPQLNIESMIPDFLHIVPVLDDAVFNGKRNLQNTSILLSLISDVLFLVLFLALFINKHVEVLRSTNDRREDASGGVLALKTGLDNT